LTDGNAQPWDFAKRTTRPTNANQCGASAVSTWIAAAISRLANRTALITDRNFAFEFDVLTIRNRWHHKLGVSFSTVLDTLVRDGHRYDQIHCSFCRWRPFGDTVSAVNFGSR
jgi:hypothetical protein